MMQNLNKKEILEVLQVTSTKPFAAEAVWDHHLDSKLTPWVRERFIPKKRCRIMAWCRPQLLPIWDLFQKWLESANESLKYLEIDKELISRFQKGLLIAYWSKSTIQLLEVILVRLRQHLRKEKIAYCSSKIYNKKFSGSFPLIVSIEDYQKLHRFLYTEGNDFEIVFFKLLPFASTYGYEMFSIKGSNVIFKKDRAYLSLERFGANKQYPLPLIISNNLLKLLRTRNILGNEQIFPSAGKVINKLDKKLTSFCIQQNIPIFAIEAVGNLVHEYLFGNKGSFDYDYEDYEYLVSLRNNRRCNKKTAKIVDDIFESIINSTPKETENFHISHLYS